MAKVIDSLDDALIDWIAEQRVFFVATAPSGPGGHVNLSPKGYDAFRVIDPVTVAYLDLTGSGVETIAHLRDNGRITIMFCAFEGPPRILRLFGAGEVLLPGTEAYDELAPRFGSKAGTRAIIRARLDRLQTSCGYSVPFMDFREERPTLAQWAARKDDAELDAYRAEKNAMSIDGLPSLGGLD